MKAECATDKLKEAAILTSRFTSKQASLQALQGILLLAEGKTLTLRATNLECGIEVSIQAKNIEQGVVAVSGGTLAALVSNLPTSSKSVTLSFEGSILKVTTNTSSSNIKSIPHEDFPILPTVSGEKTISIDSQELGKTMRSVAFCAAVSGIKPELQSVFVAAENGKMTIAATDSFRLAEKTLTFKGSDVPTLLIPIRNAAEMIRILENTKGNTTIYYSENQLSVQAEDIYFTTRLIDGTFPNYQQIIPKTYTTEAVVLKEDLSTALKTLAIFADKYAQVSVEIQPKKKQVVLSAKNPDVGEHVMELSCAAEGEGISMNFNGRYIADALQSISGESVRLGFTGVGKPLAMHPASDASFVYIVMPMNR